MRRWAIAVAVVAIAGLTIAWLAGSRMTAATPRHIAPAVAPASDVLLTAKDGVTLAATYRPGRAISSPAVLLLHGNGASRAQVAETATWLSGLGYATLAIDFRGHGESSIRPHSFGLFESRDAAAALGWLRQRQHGARIAVLGISLGGAAALLGDDGPLPADAMILQAVYPDIRRAIRSRMIAQAGPYAGIAIEPLMSLQSLPRYGVWPSRLSPVAALRHYRGPVLVIGAERDRYTPPVETREMFDAVQGPRRLWWIRGADHGGAGGEGAPGYHAQLGAFLRDVIGDPSRS